MQNIIIAASESEFNFVELCIWAGALALVLVVAFIAVTVLRKKILLSNSSAESKFALTIEQLEEMHVNGMISDEEFAAMRRGILDVGIPEKKSDKSKDDI